METLKYFPRSNSSKEVRDRLVQSCLKHGVIFQYNCSVESIRASAVSSDGEESTSSRKGAGGLGGTLHSRSKSNGRDSSVGEDEGITEAASVDDRRRDQNLRGGGGWECELKDGTHHNCDRLVSDRLVSANRSNAAKDKR